MWFSSVCVVFGLVSGFPFFVVSEKEKSLRASFAKRKQTFSIRIFIRKGKRKKRGTAVTGIRAFRRYRAPASEPLQPPARMPATTPLRPPSNSDTGSPGDRCWPKTREVEMYTCTCAGHLERRHHGCEGEIAFDLRETTWYRDAKNKKKNYYCEYCWKTCLA